MKFSTALLALALAAGATDADAARRLGGGGSVGRQSANVTQRQSAAPAPKPAAPAEAQRAARPEPAPAPVPQAQPSRWGGLLGVMAAGLGLAALAHALGFGAGFANLMLLVLVGLLVLMAVGMMRRRTAPAAVAGYANSGLSADQPLLPPRYDPQKVGNDASARPWESGYDTQHALEAESGARIGSALGSAASGLPTWSIPAGFDTEAFLQAARRNFVSLQEAWDRGDLPALRSMMTDEMLREIRSQLAGRDAVPAQKTDVVLLEAQLLGIEELDAEHMASVEFSGLIREDPSAGPTPFREVWNMTKPRDGSTGWLVAGVQALQ